MSFSKDYKREKEKRNVDEAQSSGFWKSTFHSDLTLLWFICYLKAGGTQITTKHLPPYLINNNHQHFIRLERFFTLLSAFVSVSYILLENNADEECRFHMTPDLLIGHSEAPRRSRVRDSRHLDGRTSWNTLAPAPVPRQIQTRGWSQLLKMRWWRRRKPLFTGHVLSCLISRNQWGRDHRSPMLWEG